MVDQASSAQQESPEKLAREKLVRQSVAQLSDAELLSVIIRNAGTPAVNLSERLLAECGGLAGLSDMDFKALRMQQGLGVGRAAILAAVFELARRTTTSLNAPLPQAIIRTNEDVLEIFRYQLCGLDHEEFWVLYLSSANTVVGKEKAGQGGVSGVAVDYRLVVKRAVELLASAMVLIHNHPSGVAEPSGDDHELTTRIAEAAHLFDIQVMDHLIVTANSSFSFRRAGLVK